MRVGLGRHEVSTIGKTTSLAYTGATGRVQLTTTPTKGQKFVLRATTDVCLRQGGSTVEAGTSDFKLLKGAYVEITVDHAKQSYLAAITPSGGTNGTVYVTENNNSDPGTGVSA